MVNFPSAGSGSWWKGSGGWGDKAIDYSEKSEVKLRSQGLANKMADESQSQYSNGPKENNPNNGKLSRSYY